MTQTRLLFSASADNAGKELWIADGGSATRLTDINPGATGSFPIALGQVGKFVYFTADNGDGNDLYRLDTTNNNVISVGPANSGPSFVGMTSAGLFLSMADSTHGHELWVANSAGGVSLAGDALPGTDSLSPSWGAAVGNTMVFAGNDATKGTELFASSGGTPVLVKDIRAIGSSNPSEFFAFGNAVLFSANDGGGDQLWKTDGTSASKLSDVGLPQDFFEYDNGIAKTVLFNAIPTGGGFTPYLYKTDGSSVQQVTTKVKEPYEFTLYKGKVYFSGRDDINGRELWVTDGTDSGTHMVGDFNANGSSSPSGMVEVNGKLVFTTFNSGYQLWTSDGTDPGSHLLRNFLDVGNFVVFGTKAYFVGYTSSGGYQVWTTDGSSVSLTDLAPVNDGGNLTHPIIQGLIEVPGSNKPTNGPDDLTGDKKPNTIDGMKGDDTINGAGGGDTIKGGAGNDLLSGGAGKDSLQGGGGKDTLQGGAANDTLDGGGGKDQFLFDAKPNSKNNFDHITSFKTGTDQIALDDSKFDVGDALKGKQFLALDSGHDATKSGQRVIYDKSNGELWYDSDGKGHDAAVKFAVLDNEPAKLSVHDFTIV